MSSNKLPSNRFDKYIPLFGRKNDKRVRLFLHSLERFAKQNMKEDNRSQMILQDVRFVKKDVPLINTREVDLRSIVLNTSLDQTPLKNNIPITTSTIASNPNAEPVPGQLYVHSEKECKPSNSAVIDGIADNNLRLVGAPGGGGAAALITALPPAEGYLSIQPKNNIANANINGGGQEPKWLYAISGDPNKSVPFINDNNWIENDTISLSYESNPNQRNDDKINIHSEWVKFFGEFMLRIQNTDHKNANNINNNILNIIHELSGVKEVNSVEHFMQLVVQLLFYNFNGQYKLVNDILNWDSITTFKYNDTNIIFYNFHLYNFIVSNDSNTASWFKNDKSRYLSINNCLNAALGIPFYPLSQPTHNKPYHILYGNKLYDLPQYNYEYYSDSLFDNEFIKLIKKYLKNKILSIIYTLHNPNDPQFLDVQQDFYSDLAVLFDIVFPAPVGGPGIPVVVVQQQQADLQETNNIYNQFITGELKLNNANNFNIPTNNRIINYLNALAYILYTELLKNSVKKEYNIFNINISHFNNHCNSAGNGYADYDILLINLLTIKITKEELALPQGMAYVQKQQTLTNACVQTDAEIKRLMTSKATIVGGANVYKYSFENKYNTMLQRDIFQNNSFNKTVETIYSQEQIYHANIFNTLYSVGVHDAAVPTDFTFNNIICYSEQDGHMLHRENSCIHYKFSFSIANKLLDLLNKSGINNVYKRNIKNFQDYLISKYNDTNYFSTKRYYNIETVNKEKYSQFFLETVYKEIIDLFNDNEQTTSFSYNFDKYFEQILSESDEDDTNIAIVNEKDPLSYFDSLINVDTNINKYKNIFIRKDDGILYRKEDNGLYTAINKTSEEYKQIKISNKCNTTQVKTTSEFKCYEYLNDCLLGKNLKGCKRYLSNVNFWPESVEEINNMHPSQILTTLSAFKFKIINIFDKEINLSLKFIEDVDQWKNDLIEKTKLDPKDDDYITHNEYDAIIGNSRLLFYLKHLINRINTNPAILNKNYTESMTHGYNNNIQTRAEKYGVAQGIINRNYNSDNVSKSLTLNKIPDMHNLMKDIRGLQTIFKVIPSLTPLNNPYSLKVLQGGKQLILHTPTINSIPSVSIIEDLNVLKQNLKQTNYNSSNIIEKIYNELLSKLKSINKDIEPRENKLIIDHINNLKNKENSLNNMITYINKYINLYEIYGDDNTSGTLSFDNIATYVNKHHKVLNKTNVKRNNLLSIIELIAETVANKINPNSDKDVHSQNEKNKVQSNNEIKSLFA